MEKVASSAPRSGTTLRVLRSSGKLPDGNESWWGKHNMTDKEFRCSVGLPLASKIWNGIHKSINAVSVFCQNGKKSFNSEISPASAKVSAKFGVKPGKPKDWVWIRPTIQSYWKEFLSLLFFTSKLGGNLGIVQSFEEAGGGEGVYTVLTYRWEWRQRILGQPGEALKSLLAGDRGCLE